MAIISFTNYKRGQTAGCMGAVMRYTMQDKKTEFDGRKLVTGINCQPESVYADFMTTKRLHHKTDGVLFYHMVQTGNTSIPTSSSTRSTSILERNCTSQRSRSRNCDSATTRSAWNFLFLCSSLKTGSRKPRP